MGKTKWLVAWDFVKRPKSAFYNVFGDEFGPEVERVQKSVAVCKDDFTARRLRALLQWYGASVCAFAVNGATLDAPEQDREAEQFIERIHTQRLARRGRRGT
jgi:hypothetical protein